MQNSTPSVATPTLKRRLICMVYEAFLFTAVEMFALFLFVFATQKLDQAVVFYGRQVVFVLVAAAYFIHAWTGSGHTLAMKTWRIKLVKVGFATVPVQSAVLRFIYAWGFFLPALSICHAFHLTSKSQVSIALAVNILAWGMTVFLDKDRQFLHDRLAGTRLISLPKPVKPAKAQQPAK
jgi:uncharacterized RDD family membrane protein YckC